MLRDGAKGGPHRQTRGRSSIEDKVYAAESRRSDPHPAFGHSPPSDGRKRRGEVAWFLRALRTASSGQESAGAEKDRLLPPCLIRFPEEAAVALIDIESCAADHPIGIAGQFHIEIEIAVVVEVAPCGEPSAADARFGSSWRNRFRFVRVSAGGATRVPMAMLRAPVPTRIGETATGFRRWKRSKRRRPPFPPPRKDAEA